MLTKTTISAIRALLFLAQQGESACVSPRRIAEVIGESPTYLAKALRLLVKAGILRAEKGAHGGVRLGRDPRQISLLSIVETCQGTLVGDYCLSAGEPSQYCSFHAAAEELHEAIRTVLSRWSLGALLERPYSSAGPEAQSACVMARRSLAHPAVGAAPAPLVRS